MKMYLINTAFIVYDNLLVIIKLMVFKKVLLNFE